MSNTSLQLCGKCGYELDSCICGNREVVEEPFGFGPLEEIPDKLSKNEIIALTMMHAYVSGRRTGLSRDDIPEIYTYYLDALEGNGDD